MKASIEGIDFRRGEEASSLRNRLVASDVEDLFQLILRRSVGNEEYIQGLLARKATIYDLISQLRTSRELINRMESEINTERDKTLIDKIDYRTPANLRKDQGKPKAVLLVGSCLMEPWPHFVKAGSFNIHFDLIPFNNASKLPSGRDLPRQDYAYQICQIPLRSVLKENFEDRYAEESQYEDLLARCQARLRDNFNKILKYHDELGLQTFILNFVTPQQNPMGRLQERYYLGNLVYFVEELNRYLYALASGRKNCCVIDFEQIVSNFGKKYFCDDLVSHFNHASFIGGIALGDDKKRLEAVGNLQKIYAPTPQKIIQAVVSEAEANIRSMPIRLRHTPTRFRVRPVH